MVFRKKQQKFYSNRGHAHLDLIEITTQVQNYKVLL